MVIAAIIIFIIGLFVWRPVLIPLAILLFVIGVIWDLIALFGHAVAAVF